LPEESMIMISHIHTLLKYYLGSYCEKRLTKPRVNNKVYFSIKIFL
jgi:hypothetical protein